MHRNTATDQPWYLEPAALAVIAGMTERPETRGGEVSYSPFTGNTQYSPILYVGTAVAALQAHWTRRFNEIDAITPWPQATYEAVLACASEQDVVAAMFGPASGYAWAKETEECRKLKRIRREIEDALEAVKVAA